MQTEPKTQPPRLPKPLRITEQVWPEGTVPVVSIHCITYQHGKFIREAIEGFLMQETTFPVEILIHDDASTDGTADIIREYEAKYTQLIKPIYQTENQWSKGNKPGQINLARAKGEFIALCEGDDYWTSPHKLQKQAEILEANPDSFMVGAYSMTLSENGTEKSEGDYVLGPFPVKERYSLKELFRQGFHTSTYLLRAAIVGEFRVFASGCAVTNGDTVLQTLAAAKGDVLLLDEVVSRYRLHSGGVWTGAKPHKKFSDVQKTLKLLDAYLGGRYTKELTSAAIYLAEMQSRNLIAHQRPFAAFAVYAVTVRSVFPRSLCRLLTWPILLPFYRWPNLMNKLTMKVALRSRVRQLKSVLSAK
jgi:glycosyltransferase involved in cell wall biosynthesis